jgi:hypothetical protein
MGNPRVAVLALAGSLWAAQAHADTWIRISCQENDGRGAYSDTFVLNLTKMLAWRVGDTSDTAWPITASENTYHWWALDLDRTTLILRYGSVWSYQCQQVHPQL